MRTLIPQLRAAIGVFDRLRKLRCGDPGDLRLAEPDDEQAGIRGASLYFHLLARLVCSANVKADVFAFNGDKQFRGAR